MLIMAKLWPDLQHLSFVSTDWAIELLNPQTGLVLDTWQFVNMNPFIAIIAQLTAHSRHIQN